MLHRYYQLQLAKQPLISQNDLQQMSSVQTIPNLSQETLLNALHREYPSAAIFTVVPGYQSVTLAHSPQPLIPKPLTSMYNPK